MLNDFSIFFKIRAGVPEIRGGYIVEFNLKQLKTTVYSDGTSKWKKIVEMIVEKSGMYFSFEERDNGKDKLYLADIDYSNGEIEEDCLEDNEDEMDSYVIRTSSLKDEKINIEVLKYEITSGGDEYITHFMKEEFCILSNKRYKEQVSKDPIYSFDYICSLELFEVDFLLAISLREKIMEEVMSGIEIENYREIFEKIYDICKGKAVIVCHKKSFFSDSKDYIISRKDIFANFNYYCNGEKTLISNNEYQPISFTIFQLIKEVEVEENKYYVGSYFAEGGYPIDVYKTIRFNEDEECIFEFQIHVNFSGFASGKIEDFFGNIDLDKSLKGKRFFIENGSEFPFRYLK